jgi:hypothetical protein
MQAVEDIRTLVRILHDFRNVRIVLWSGSGELWARQVARAVHVEQWVDEYDNKATSLIKPDIAIDDMEDMKLGGINLIVKDLAV